MYVIFEPVVWGLPELELLCPWSCFKNLFCSHFCPNISGTSFLKVLLLTSDVLCLQNRDDWNLFFLEFLFPFDG